MRELMNEDYRTARRFAMEVMLVFLGLLLAVGVLHAQSNPTPGGGNAQREPGQTGDALPSSTQAALNELPPVKPARKPSYMRKMVTPKPTIGASSLNEYLARVRAESSMAQPTPGSLWTDNGRLTRMSTDVRAMRPNDLISVVVSENLAASQTGQVKNSRASNASSQITSLFGLLKAGNALQNIVGQTSALGLSAQGASATNSSLTTTLGGQVVDVLSNGMLVIEAARQVEFSQQTQTIVLRGLVRPEDISQQNQVLSTAISSLELEVKGKGIVSDSTYRQNPLVRLLEKIVIF